MAKYEATMWFRCTAQQKERAEEGAAEMSKKFGVDVTVADYLRRAVDDMNRATLGERA